jgi:hypothetical protein
LFEAAFLPAAGPLTGPAMPALSENAALFGKIALVGSKRAQVRELFEWSVATRSRFELGTCDG